MIDIWIDLGLLIAWSLIALIVGIWIGVAHGAQIGYLLDRFRSEPKMTPETARAVLFAMQDELAPLPIVVDPDCPPDRIYIIHKDRLMAPDGKRVMVLNLDESGSKDV